MNLEERGRLTIFIIRMESYILLQKFMQMRNQRKI